MSKQVQLDCIIDAEQRLLVALYGGKDDDTLNGLRFQLFTKSLVKVNFNLTSQPPTLEAVRQHCLRADSNVVGSSDESAELGLANCQTWSGSNCQYQRSSSTVAFNGHILKIQLKDVDPLAAAENRKFKYSSICANCKGNSCSNAPPKTNEQMSQLSEEDKDPNDAEETAQF
ncbi:hypothetical protein AVEN_231076-1 [Araneus ventricosus]|uniref:Uncharacterized protein n=1 Tax=Araneus ventricosus TaxID=182803 RepID=A0A4Y2A3D8_ARAVE|nr:hypothetical protein AVEN_231076-1 [Araneus ventricosus]